MPLKKYSYIILLLIVLMSGAVWASQQGLLVAIQPQETGVAESGVATSSSSLLPMASQQSTINETTPEPTTAAVTPRPTTAASSEQTTLQPTPSTSVTHQPMVLQPSLTATPTVTPKPTATPTVTPKPTATPTVTPKPTATPNVTPKPTATPTPTPTPTMAPGSLTESQWIAEVFRLTNLERQAKGLPAFQQPSATLLQAAAVRARECATSFSHTRPDGTEWHTVLVGIDYRTAGENIASGTTGYLSPQMVVDMWMNSPGHRANILKADFTTMGVGFYRSAEDKTDYLSQLFIG